MIRHRDKQNNRKRSPCGSVYLQFESTYRISYFAPTIREDVRHDIHYLRIYVVTFINNKCVTKWHDMHHLNIPRTNRTWMKPVGVTQRSSPKQKINGSHSSLDQTEWNKICHALLTLKIKILFNPCKTMDQQAQSNRMTKNKKSESIVFIHLSINLNETNFVTFSHAML